MATTTATRMVKCENCGRMNRVPAAAQVTIPVLVDLWAAWCGPCRMVSPALEQLAREKAGQLKLVKVDIERAPKLAQRFSVQAVRTLMVMYRGEVIARQSGAAPVEALRRWGDGAIARIPSDSR